MLKFINNFTAALTVQLAAADTTAGIGTASATALAALVGSSGITGPHQMMLTLDDGIDVEIVVLHSAFASGGVITITRGHENTTPKAWPAGSKISARLTARAMAALPMLAVAMQLTDANGVLQDADGNILTSPDMPTYFGGTDPYGLINQ